MKDIIFWILIELGGAILGYIAFKYIFREIAYRRKFHEDDQEMQQWATIIQQVGESNDVNMRMFILSLFIWIPVVIIAFLLFLIGIMRKLLRRNT